MTRHGGGRKARGTHGEWTSDVLQVVRSLRKKQFFLSEIYDHEAELSKLHPENNHVRAKIRQQLQILRDDGILEFIGHGQYQMLK